MPASYLYVPGDRPERYNKALTSGAHAVIVDLEDAVAVPKKDYARASVIENLPHRAERSVEVWVRVNVGSRGLEDVRAIATHPGLTGIVVPKATGESLAEVVPIAALPILALVESAAAMIDLKIIVGMAGVVGLMLGEIDLAGDLGLDPSEDDRELWTFRMQSVAVSAAFGLQPPVGPVLPDLNDLERLRESTIALRRAGFASRQAIHPLQVHAINEEMVPSASQVEQAEALLAHNETVVGGAYLDAAGHMVDAAVVRRARSVLARRR